MPCKPSRYGTWPSPVTSTLLASDSVSLDELRLHDTATYWIEKRPGEEGRCVIVKHQNHIIIDVLPRAFSARSRVHEYGGGVYCISDNGVYFVNDLDQNIYHYADHGTPCAITQTNSTAYAELQYDNHRQRLICVSQQHSTTGAEPINSLVSISLSTGEIHTLHTGHDFYSNPRISPCGTKLSWLCWNHPDMPWDNTQLWLADIGINQLSNSQQITQASTQKISIFQPEWSPDGVLHFISDESGWWNLYRYIHREIEQLTHLHQEFGRPQWVFSQSTYAFIDDLHVLCAPIENGITKLLLLNTNSKTLSPVDTRCNSISSLQSSGDFSWFIGASEESFPEIISFNNITHGHRRVRSSCKIQLDTRYYSHGQTIKFTTRHHDDAYAIYYRPINIDVLPEAGEKPPLIVLTHGGPTAMSEPSLVLRTQFWTSRGFAVLDVNYSGSTGYGRAYRERLDYKWGIRDAEDCCDAALHIVSQGLADPERLIIKGSSAGGYTVLCALTFHDVFAAGASYYGISNLESLLKHTHKFESCYLTRLVGPYPEQKKRYQDRSPLNHADLLNCPVIFFQGTEDKVVPMEQAEKMYNALKNKGVPVSYILFPGEQHGFRKAETIQTAINTEYAFYAKIFKLDIENVVPVHIDNFTTL